MPWCAGEAKNCFSILFINEWPKFFVMSLPIVQPLWLQFYFFCCISHCCVIRLSEVIILHIAPLNLANLIARLKQSRSMPQLPVDTRYLLNVIESKQKPSFSFVLLPNMNFFLNLSKRKKCFFLVWIRREEKWKILKLYKVRFSETWSLSSNLFAQS